jgi:hypothetical protein
MKKGTPIHKTIIYILDFTDMSEIEPDQLTAWAMSGGGAIWKEDEVILDGEDYDEYFAMLTGPGTDNEETEDA